MTVDDRIPRNVPERDILPIFVPDYASEPPALISHEGTGFVLGKNVFVTCWHCLRTELQDQLRYTAAKEHNGQYTLYPLIDIQQDPRGTDLATAIVSLESEMGLTIAEGSVSPYGTDIWSFGYPLTTFQSHPQTPMLKRFTLNGRYMQSYVMRAFHNDVPTFGQTASFELDMPALAGMSGAPIVQVGSREGIGVLYGRNDAETIEEFGSRDPDTGERLTPEVVRMTYFAAAHFIDTLKNLRGKATQGLPLFDFFERVEAC